MDDNLLSPEDEQAYKQLGLLTDQRGQYEDQLLRAQALRDMQYQKHTTGLGGALGALGQIINSGVGAYSEKKAREDLAKNSQDTAPVAVQVARSALRRDSIRDANHNAALIAFLRGQPPAPPDDGTPTMLRRPQEDSLPFALNNPFGF